MKKLFFIAAVLLWSSFQLTAQLTHRETLVDNQNGHMGLGYPGTSVISDDGQFLYIPASVDAGISVYKRNTDGTLTLVQLFKSGVGELDYLYMSKDQRHIYGISFGGVIASLARNPEDGKLTLIELQKEGENGIYGMKQAKNIVESNNGMFIYVLASMSSSEDNGGVVIFSRDMNNGHLYYHNRYKFLPEGYEENALLYNMALSPNGQYLYFLYTNSPHMVIASIDENNGTLQQTGRQDYPNDISSSDELIFSPDGAYAYLLSYQKLSLFTRDVNNERLTYQRSVVADGVTDLEISHDGKHIYGVAPFYDGGLRVYKTNGTSLSLSQNFKDKELDNLGGAYSSVISPDNKYVYILSLTKHALHIFENNGNTSSGTVGNNSNPTNNGSSGGSDDNYGYANSYTITIPAGGGAGTVTQGGSQPDKFNNNSTTTNTNNSGGGCSTSDVNSGDLSNMKSQIDEEFSNFNKMDKAKELIKGRCLSASQVAELTQLFSFDSSKLEFAKFAADYTYDLYNYESVVQQLGFSSMQEELREYIAKKQ